MVTQLCCLPTSPFKCMLLQDYASDPVFQQLVKTFDSFWDVELSANDAVP